MAGKTLQIVGAGAATFAVPLLLYRFTGSTAASGALTALAEAAGVVASVPAGVVADRHDRRRLLIVVSAIGALAWAVIVWGGFAGFLTTWLLACVVVVAAIGDAIYAPAETAGIRALSRPEEMGSIASLMQGRSAAANLLSGPLGGILYAVGAGMPALAGALGHAVAGVCALFVRRPMSRATRPAEPPLRSLTEGLRFAWSSPLLRSIPIFLVALNLGCEAVLSGFTLHFVATGVDSVLIGLAQTSVGAVMLVGAAISPWIVKRVRGSVILLWGTTALGVCLALTSVVDGFWPMVVLLSLGFLTTPPVDAAFLGYVTAIVPDEMQGRVSGIIALSAMAAAPLGPLLAGVLLEYVNIHVAMAVPAAILAFALVVMWTNRWVRAIGRPETWAADALPLPSRRAEGDAGER